ncbi:MAG TPA: hypothetical protein VJN18_11020 [Polyangiaceae bacterium]|nr:hypothetical protein [Polyangiaceae bacterium]
MRTARSTELDWFRGGPLGLDNYRRQLGRSAVLCSDAQALQQTLIFTGATQNRSARGKGDLQGRADGDAAASLVQVSCTYESLNAQNADRPLYIRGTIAWGTDGHQCVAEFDWLNGTIVQVCGSSIKVSARIVGNLGATDEAPTFDPAAAVRVGATIGYWASSRLAPTLTTQVRLAGAEPPDPNAQVAVAIPRFARRLWVVGPTLTALQWAIGPNLGQEIGAVDAPVSSRQGYERPGVATHLVLTGGLVSTLTTLTWELAL